MGLRVIKPLLTGFLYRTYRRNGHHLALTGFVAFPFSDPDLPISEQKMWESLAPVLPSDAVWDEGIPKDRGEVLLIATCHAPGGAPVPSRQVLVQVGPVAKTLLVSGESFWAREKGLLRRSPPSPFTSLPVDWSHAFGGPGYAANPTGKGYADPTDGSPRPLPNIEDPREPLVSPEDRPAPAGFGPLSLLWSQRLSRAGRYESGEIGQDPPPLPRNADWTLYNQALPDQWIPGFWSGGESFCLEGLHPEKDRLEGRLPRMRLRSVVTWKTGEVSDLFLHPETVWLFPELEIGVVVHRASLLLESGDPGTLLSILLAGEDPGENRSLGHYLTVRDRRLEGDPRDLSRFSDVPLLPQRLENDPRARSLDAEYLFSKIPNRSEKKIATILKAQMAEIDRSLSLSLGEEGAFPPGSSGREQIEEKRKVLGETVAGLEKNPPRTLKDLLAEVEEKKGEDPGGQAAVESRLNATIDRLSPETLEASAMDRTALLEALRKKPEAPPKSAPPSGNIQELLQDIRRRGLPNERSGRSPEDTSPERGGELESASRRLAAEEEKIRELLDKKGKKALIRALHHFSPPAFDPAVARGHRERVENGLRSGRNFSGASLRGADLSGLDLTECDFSECDLIGADLSGATLTRARFGGAWMAHTSLSRSLLDGADFTGAALGCADLSGARGQETIFEGAVLTGAVFSGCLFEKARFSGSDLIQAFLGGAALKNSDLSGAKFLKIGPLPYPSPAAPRKEEAGEHLNLRGVDLSGSDLTKALFMKSDLSGANLSGSTLTSATFLECTGPGLRCSGSVLQKTAFPNSTDFSRADFRRADLTGANLRDLDLTEGDFREATLSRADLSGSRLSGATLSGCRAVGARFLKADLKNLDARGGDFREALFLNADLRFADFSHGSLYKAGFSGALRDDSTRWDQALVGKSVLRGERPA